MDIGPPVKIDATQEEEEEDILSSMLDMYQNNFNRYETEREWHRQLQITLPMRLLYDNWHYVLKVDQPYHEPDPGYVRKLNEISPDLSVHWIGRDHRWGHFIKHRVYYEIPYNGAIFRVQDTFWMNTEILKGPEGEYIPLDERSLPELNFNKLDIFGYMTMMDNAYEEMVKREKKKDDELFWGYHNEYGRVLERMLCKHFNIQHIGKIPVGIDLKKRGSHGSSTSN